MAISRRYQRSSKTRSRHDWLPTAVSGPLVQSGNFYLLIILLGACAFGGGSSFANVTSLLYVRPIAVVCLVGAILIPRPSEWRMFRMPLIMLCLFALLMVVQLIPLPPSIWTVLPGREPYIELARLSGINQPWRPISLTPDLTMNSLVSLIVPAAILAGFVKLRLDQRRFMIVAVVTLCCASAALGVAQFAGGERSVLYWYQRTYPGFPVGFLSNRNHQAVLLALAFPALRVWTLGFAESRALAQRRQWLALGLGILLVPIILATGSRAGMAVTILSLGVTFTLFGKPHGLRAEGMKASHLRILAWFGGAVILLGLVMLTYIFGRAASIDRLASLGTMQENQRFLYAPMVVHIISDMFPIGAGFGSFDPVFRQYEPDGILRSSYFNHAHNELLELALMSGAAGLILLAGFISWWAVRIVGTLRDTDSSTERHMARLGGAIIAFVLLASLVDYPLRAPLMAAVFTIACCWLCERPTVKSLRKVA